MNAPFILPEEYEYEYDNVGMNMINGKLHKHKGTQNGIQNV